MYVLFDIVQIQRNLTSVVAPLDAPKLGIVDCSN